jgi:tetratricopeptide (TPR) repeat protein
MPLPAGTRIAFEYVYDNSEQNDALPARAPRRVVFGQRSEDEMGTLTLSLAVADADRRALDAAMVDSDLAKVPRAWNLWLKKARLLRERGDLAGARTALMRAVDISPGAADIPFELGLVHEQEGKLPEAQRCHEAALQLDPQHGLAHLQLGALLGRAGKDDEARACFEKAIAALPNSSLAHANLATANSQLGRFSVARTHYERAVALEPERFGAWVGLGVACAELGDRDAARTALRRALKLRPEDAFAKRVLAKLDG